MNTSLKRFAAILSALIGIHLWLIASADAAEQAVRPVLHLTDGGFVPGELRASDDPAMIRWRSPLFARPLEFPLGAVRAVHYPVPPAPPRPRGEFGFELVNGDVLYGELLKLTDDELVVNSPRVGRVSLRREHVRRLFRWEGAEPVYLGPSGLAGWKDLSTAPLWHEEGGQLTADKPGAALFGDLGLPEKAAIEIELSWQRKPDFVLAIGVNEQAATAKNAFRLEIWDGNLVAVGESARDADVAAIQKIGKGEGHVRIQAYLDQKQRRLILLSPGGKGLADLTIDEKDPHVFAGVCLTNGQGDVRLEHVRITRWNGIVPREVREDQARLHRPDGSIVYGRLASYDPATKQFTIRDGTTETAVAHDAVTDVFLTPPAADGAPAEPTLRVVYGDGSRFSGVLTRVEDDHLSLTCPGVKEPLRLPLTDIRSLIALRRDGGASGPAVAGRAGQLELDGLSLKGRLVDGDVPPDASCLVWHPDLGANASPLAKGVSGRIVYRDQPPPAPAALATPNRPVVQRFVNANGAVVVGQVMVNINGLAVVQNGVGGQVPNQALRVHPPTSGRRSLHLRTGDTIPCEVTRIDEQGVTFRSPATSTTFVAHERIKSVELVDGQYSNGTEEAKRDRLLTLPRMQKNSPPTHLIYAKNGDFLRGRIVEMDDRRLKIEVRLEVKELPRDRVAQIIWLHADELGDAKPADPPAAPSPANRVQIIRPDGNRLTFVAEKADHASISGTSDVLGQCRATLAEVDQLLIGSFIEQSATQLAYNLWKLHPAVEPKFAQADPEAAADGRLTGTESPLVGQPSPPVKLDMLDGTKFDLAERKGRVVVLDFWATWCGPCMQSMPVVEALVKEFADKGVDLVAVNLEEQPAQIKSVLERHKLTPPVALDRDGKVAAKYAVTAIPQTVVIDREGKVVRLFVGGGKNTQEALRKALQELTADQPPARR